MRWSDRYGDLDAIAAKTDGKCHLCHEHCDLDLYGPTGAFGDETCTIDHHEPQSHGGGDDFENLFIAHGTCNSVRGTADVEAVRYLLAGTDAAPLSSGASAARSAALGCAAGAVGGRVFATTDEFGNRQFNWGAALGFGFLVAALTR